MIRLRDNTKAEPGFSRLKQFDPRSRQNPVTVTKKPITKLWNIHTVYGQRGGSCVAYAMVHELLAAPVEVDADLADYWYAYKLYFKMQRSDQFPGGEYPGANPVMQGTSILAGCKIMKQEGWIKGYKWAFNQAQLKKGVSYKGPAVIGINWYEGMIEPNKNGFIRPTGAYVGGHAILVIGVNMEEKYFTLQNSWSGNWGVGGTCKIKFKHMKALLAQQGEVVFFTGRRLTPKK